MAKVNKAEAFLQAMAQTKIPGEVPSTFESVESEPKPVPQARTAPRSGLKHIGGYFDRDTVEKVAVLRARLGLDNSALIKLAIEDLYRKNLAKRAFGDE